MARRAQGTCPRGCGIVGVSVAPGIPPKARLRCGRTVLSHPLQPCSDSRDAGSRRPSHCHPQTAQTGGLGAQLWCRGLPESKRSRTGLDKWPPTSDKQRVRPVSWAWRGDAQLEPRGSAELLEETGILIGKKRELLSPDLR